MRRHMTSTDLDTERYRHHVCEIKNKIKTWHPVLGYNEKPLFSFNFINIKYL